MNSPIKFKNEFQNISYLLILLFTVIFLFYFSFLSNSSPSELSEELAEKHIQIADSIITTRTIENINKAIIEYEKALRFEPASYEALWKISRAYVFFIDIKTEAFLEKKDEYKPILKEYGKIAYEYAEAAYKINPEGKEGIAFFLQSYGYYVGSFDIFEVIFKGPAGKIKKLAKKLIEIDNTYYACTGYQALGRLYYEAPWPAGSTKKSKNYFNQALKIENTLLIPHYWLGRIYFDKKEYQKALIEFEFVVNNPPSKITYHIIQIYKDSANNYIYEIKKDGKIK